MLRNGNCQPPMSTGTGCLVAKLLTVIIPHQLSHVSAVLHPPVLTHTPDAHLRFSPPRASHTLRTGPPRCIKHSTTSVTHFSHVKDKTAHNSSVIADRYEVFPSKSSLCIPSAYKACYMYMATTAKYIRSYLYC